jgi:3',5'-cyclic AMP phosphodiesterase CpdA
VVIGGDLIDDANSGDQTNEFLAITAEIDEDIPVRWVPGNHDIAVDAVTPTRESISAYRDVFGDDYYSFLHKTTLFIALNTPVIDHPEEVPGEWERQFGFLQDEMETARRGGVDHVVLLGHHPLFLEQPDEPDTYWNLPTERRLLLLEAIHAAGVRIGFAGHWHRNSIGVDGDFVQVTSGPVGYPLGVDPSGYRIVAVNRERVDHEYRALGDPPNRR